jgi:hypothetical protein
LRILEDCPNPVNCQQRISGNLEAANAIVKNPIALYIEKMYDEADFTGTGM